MNLIKKELIYYLIIAITYYLLPFLIIDTGSAMFMLLIVMPLIVLITSFICGLKNGFHIWYAVIVGLLFIPTIYLHYNESAWIYTLIFGALALTGNALVLLKPKK